MDSMLDDERVIVGGPRRTLALALTVALAGCSDDGVAQGEGGGGGGGPSSGGVDSTGSDAASATAGTGTDASGTDTSGTADSTTADSTGGTSGLDPATCDEIDPAADATFDLAIGDWDVMVDEIMFQLDTACTVTAVEVASTIITSLDCTDDAEVVHAVELEIANADGTPSWAPGATVTLSASGVTNTGGALPDGIGAVYVLWAFSLRSAEDGALLAAGTRGWSLAATLAPLEFEIVDTTICGVVEPCSTDDDRPLAMRIAEPGGESLEMLGGRRGTLGLLDGTTLHVDAPLAHASSSCHGTVAFVMLARRMQ